MPTLPVCASALQWWQTLWVKILFGFLGLLLLAYLISRYAKYKVRQSQQKYTMELRNKDLEAQALFSQLNSHFVFNALVPFQDLTIRGDKDGALSYINKFASLMRGMLNNSRMKNVTLKAEISFITHYLEVQQQRYKNFDFTINIAENISPSSVTIPTLFVQPIVENAIEHGIKKLANRGKIDITITYLHDNALSIIISDNGKGFEKGMVVVEHHAVQIIQERLSLLKKMGQEASLTFENNADGGAKVILALPFTNS